MMNGHSTRHHLLSIQKNIVADTRAIYECFRQQKWDEVQRLAAMVLHSNSEDSEDEYEEEMLISVDDDQLSFVDENEDFSEDDLSVVEANSQDSDASDAFHRLTQPSSDSSLSYSRSSE